MKILILHHIEPEYRDFFNDEDLFRELFRHLRRHTYDRIVLTTISGRVYTELEAVISEHREWDYYWEDPTEGSGRSRIPRSHVRRSRPWHGSESQANYGARDPRVD